MRISDWSSDVCSSDRLVSKAGATGMADKALFGQLGGYPTAIGVSAFLMGAMALLPGIPMLPFLGIAGVAGWAAWKIAQRHALAAGETDKTAQAATQAPVAEEPIATALQIDEVRLALGYALLALTRGENGHPPPDPITGPPPQPA